MKRIQLRHYVLAALATVFFTACNDSDTGSGTTTTTNDTLPADTAKNVNNPIQMQKTGDTYNPRLTDTDTIYKGKDSIPK